MNMPSRNCDGPNLFDRFADHVARFSSKAWFFAACVALVVIWAPSFLILPNIDTWQLAINTPTTVITFLLVALLQNTQKRADDAVQQKLNAMAAFLLSPDDRQATAELRRAVGLEDHEAS